MPSASFLTVLPIVSSSRGLEWDPDHINALITYVSLNFCLACALQEKKGVFVLVKLYLWFFLSVGGVLRSYFFQTVIFSPGGRSKIKTQEANKT